MARFQSAVQWLITLCVAACFIGAVIHSCSGRAARSTDCPACGGPTWRPMAEQPHRECLKCGLRFNPDAIGPGTKFERPDRK